MRLLVLDTTSILFRHFHASKAYDNDEAIINGLTTMQALNTIKSAYDKLKPTAIVATFDRSSWRKNLTIRDDSFDFIYERNRAERRKDPTEKRIYGSLRGHRDGFEERLREHTAT